MQKIVFTVDSSCDISEKYLTENNIAVLPFRISIDGEEFVDGVTITRDTLYEKVEKTGQMPKTSAISPADYTEFFEKQLEGGDALVHFSLGSGFSSACQNATIAASEFDNVFVVDTMSLSSGEALVLLHAIALRESGMDAAAIKEDCTAYAKKCDVSFVLDRLDYIHKGGRCSGVTALGANLLGIKPCLGLHDGKLGIDTKYRGKLKMVVSKYIRERLEGVEPLDDYVFLTNAGVEQEVFDAAYAALKETGKFKTICVADAGCVISSHCGPGTLGILFARK